MEDTYMCEKWNGFECRRFLFEEHNAFVVLPEEGTSNGYLAIKTEYWEAFPEACEIDLLKKWISLMFYSE